MTFYLLYCITAVYSRFGLQYEVGIVNVVFKLPAKQDKSQITAMKIKTIFIVAAIISTITVGCNHDTTTVAGKGGNATVIVYPQHHEVAKNLINFKVYVKYNTHDAPSNGVYDDSVACINHDSLVSCSFAGLRNGNYYFYGKGYDTSISGDLKGGTPYTITQQASQSMNLPVSE